MNSFTALVIFLGAAHAATPVNPVLFVTQVPVPNEVNAGTVSNVTVSVASALGNHLGDTAHAARGGDLWIRYPSGTLKYLTRAAGFGVAGPQHTNGIAVREPSMHWTGTNATFSRVVGAPQFADDNTTFFWQLYEVTNFLDPLTTPVITKVSNQPANYNNVSPCYGTDDRIIFACDRPRDGSALLHTRRNGESLYPN